MSDDQVQHLQLSDWIRANCPSSATGWTCSDVDYIVHQYKTKHVVVLEVKRHKLGPQGGKVPMAQKEILRMLDSCLRVGMMQLFSEYTYHGVWLIQFERTWFDDGKCYLNGDEINEEQLLHALSTFDRVGHLQNRVGGPNHPMPHTSHSVEPQNQKGRHDI